MKRFWIMSTLILMLPSLASATGLMIPKDRSIGPLAIKYHRAEVKITDRVAVTHVDQVFVNHTNRDLEATYIFPLPKGATVSDFYLYMNGKKTKGEVLEKNRARNIYEGIVRRMKDPGLLEYLGRDLFQARVYPVPKRGEARIEIEFTQLLPFEGGVNKFSYPMRTDRSSSRTMKDFTLSVKISSKTPIKTIYSPSHEIYTRKKDDHHASAGFEKNAAVLDRDFELFYTVSEKDIGMNLLTYREPGEPGFFMLMVSPKSEYTSREIIGKHITFVIDTSGSMAGAKIRHAKKALKYCLNKLNPDDRFNLIRFSTDVEAFQKTPSSASKANIQRALNFVNRIEAAGGTAIDEALTTALAVHKNSKEPNLIVFMTDGHPTVGETNPKSILAHSRKGNRVSARVFVFGIGNEINTHLLDKISSENFAESTYAKPNEEIEQKLSAFYNKVSFPVLSDLNMDFGSIHEYDVLPKRLSDLFKGSQLLVFGRYRNRGHTALTLRGKVGDKTKKFVFEGRFPKKASEHDFIPRLWATRKIGFLLDNIRLGGEKKELVDEVIRLSKRYGIVTPYTSYLVTEDQVVARPSQPVIPRPTPRGPIRRTRPGWGRVATKSADSSSSPSADVLGGLEAEGAIAPSVMAPPPPRAKAKKARSRFQAYHREESKLLEKNTGATAVDFAETVKGMKTAKSDAVDEDDAAGIRHVAGYTFKFRAGAWVDLKYKPGMQTLKIKYLSKAYFELLKKSKKLKRLFGLGQRVTIVVGKNRAIVVGPDGRDTVSDSELKKYLIK
ncbi:MAG: VWA domain-containing protein [Deltaproteobacteria bacterium]|nr:VWA domain-containing protein [Deltaproteobacteria bacterium]